MILVKQNMQIVAILFILFSCSQQADEYRCYSRRDKDDFCGDCQTFTKDGEYITCITCQGGKSNNERVHQNEIKPNKNLGEHSCMEDSNIIGIVMGSIVAICAVICGCFCFCKWCRKNPVEAGECCCFIGGVLSEGGS